MHYLPDFNARASAAASQLRPQTARPAARASDSFGGGGGGGGGGEGGGGGGGGGRGGGGSMGPARASGGTGGGGGGRAGSMGPPRATGGTESGSLIGSPYVASGHATPHSSPGALDAVPKRPLSARPSPRASDAVAASARPSAVTWASSTSTSAAPAPSPLAAAAVAAAHRAVPPPAMRPPYGVVADLDYPTGHRPGLVPPPAAKAAGQPRATTVTRPASARPASSACRSTGASLASSDDLAGVGRAGSTRTQVRERLAQRGVTAGYGLPDVAQHIRQHIRHHIRQHILNLVSRVQWHPMMWQAIPARP